MGALLTAARLSDDKNNWLVAGALALPMALHAAYDFPLFALPKTGENIWLGAAWLAVIIVSPIVAIALCNRVLPSAVAADRASGRDGGSTETTDRLLVGGFASLAAG